MDDQWKIPWMIWGYPCFRKPSNVDHIFPCQRRYKELVAAFESSKSLVQSVAWRSMGDVTADGDGKRESLKAGNLHTGYFIKIILAAYLEYRIDHFDLKKHLPESVKNTLHRTKHIFRNRKKKKLYIEYMKNIHFRSRGKNPQVLGHGSIAADWDSNFCSVRHR